MQFLKFQAFAEQLTKETQDLKVKIENHKREHRRLSSLIEQQKDDAARLTMRLSGTEKQRDDALEALVLQQEIAEELERERKRNKKELAALQHTNVTLIHQRDESQRVVLHLRSLIDGQTHHMEHIIRSLNKAPELNAYIGEGFEDAQEDQEDNDREPTIGLSPIAEVQRAESRASNKAEDSRVTPEMESKFFTGLAGTKPGSRLSISDVADRHLRDKTDAIADIIRNISEQCAAAVEGLQLAHDAEEQDEMAEDGQIDPSLKNGKTHHSSGVTAPLSSPRKTSLEPSDPESADTRLETDSGHGGSTGHLTPNGERDEANRRSDSRSSSIIPPTPDLIGGRSSSANGRSSTSMSGYSNSTSNMGGRDRDSATLGSSVITAAAKDNAIGANNNSTGSASTKIVGVDPGVHGEGMSDNGDAVAVDAREIDDVVGGKKSAVDVVRGGGVRVQSQ